MRDVFLNLTALTQSDWFKNLPDRRPLPKKQVLKSLRVEDEVYRQTRPQSMTLDLLEEGMLARLPTAPNLSRDVFQSFYSLSLRHNEESELEPKVRRFNRYLLDKMMQQPDFPAVKALCEGKPLPSIEAAEEFMQQISDHLDELLAAAGGDKNLLDTLSLQEQRQVERLDTIRRQAERLAVFLTEQCVVYLPAPCIHHGAIDAAKRTKPLGPCLHWEEIELGRIYIHGRPARIRAANGAAKAEIEWLDEA